MPDSNHPPKSSTTGAPGPGTPAGQGTQSKRTRTSPASSSPTGTSRHGRRETARRRRDDEPMLQRLRTPVLAVVVIVAIVGVGLWVLTSAAQPAYACTAIDTVQPAASGELGQLQPDMGNKHVQSGDKVTYQVCPPASGKHVNQQGFGPLQPKVYGPDDKSLPNGWVHNLEHGGLVLLYSCDKGACDDAALAQLRTFSSGFPASPVCGLPAGTVGPVIARFEQMPTKYAALVWGRALYMDTLDAQQAYDFYTRYGERVVDGTFVAPPEPQCAVPSPSAPAGASEAPSPAAS